ncbi:Transposon Ty3-G Gag-Pol polyprotein [Labeo rohita]|uniref:ribonuclease H n=1 Tax=Labeo rohita TaxID=84645 RepID=A0ABQ8LAJ6_LABRO|nr:Transposon Ty3-G Gag-Pol polyprotein [Labeo rohita]
MSVKRKSVKSGESGPRFTLCVPPCKRYITSGDTHSMCVVCLGAEHAMSALERTDCPHCEALPLRVLRSRKALFEEGAFTSVPQGVGPASVEAERALHSWGSQLDLLEGMETGDPLSPSLTGRSVARSEGSEARTVVTSPQGAGSSLLLSSSEEVDLESAIEEPLPQSPQYEELLEVVTRAVDKLKIDWPAEVKATPQRSKLDERFLRSKPPPPMRSLPFFPDLHAEISRSWERPFSARLFVPASDYYGNVVGLDERAYKAMPRVEQTLASYLSPSGASSLKAPTLPSKPLRTTSALVGKGYTAAGQAGACLHTMSVLQAHQADLLKGLAEGEKVDLEELQRTADLALRATKETARAVGRSMAAMVAAERHLWLTLSDMKEKDRVFLLDAPLQPSGLFGDAVDSVVSRYQEARKQAAAFQRFLPRRSLASTAAGRTETRGTLGRGPPRRGPTCGSCFSLGGPRPQSGPDARPGPPRAAPTGGERVTPHYTVAVSPRCPREVGLLFLPGLQDTTASDELLPRISPPGIVAEPGCSSPPRGSLEQLVRQSPAGPPLQVSELVVQSNPEASLERLVPLVDYLAAWKLLPNVSAWVLRTVEKGYAIQFGAPPPPFDGVFPTLVGPKQALVMEQEVETLLRKEAIEVVPPHVRESGFYSRYFIVPKKDGGLRPIIDLRRLNQSVMKLKFKMLTIKQVVSQIRSEDWFVTIDLKDAYFHVSILPQHRKFLRFAFRGEAYQYRVLPFGLALSPRTFTKCVDAALVPLRLQGIRILNYIDDWLILAASENLAARHRDVVLAHMKTGPLIWAWCGIRPRCRHVCPLLGSRRSSPQSRESSRAGHSLSNSFNNYWVDGSSVQRDTFWPAVHETPTVVAQIKGFSLRGNPLRMIKVTRRGLRALDMWKKPWFLNQGPTLGVPCRRVTLATDASLTGWGGGHEWSPRPRSLDESSSQLAHQLPRDAGCISSAEVLPPRPQRSPCAGSHRQHSGGLLHQPPGRSAVAPLMQAGAPDPCVVPGQTPLPSSSSYSWAFECGSRHPVETGAEARGMDASPRDGEADMGDLWASPIRSLCHKGECTMSPLVLSSSSSSPGAGCYGTDVAEASSVCLSPDRSAPRSSGESTPGRGQPTISSPVLAGPSMVLGPDISPRRLSMGDSRQEGSPLTGGGHHPAPPSGVVEAVGVAPEGAQLIDSGLSTEVVETILQSRAPSTRKLYALKWKLFTSWCGERQQDPANCPVGTVLEFLQARFSTGLAHSTLKVYVAAISAYHAPLDGISVGKNPLVIRFLRGVLRLRPPTRPRVPTWDLAVVLEALCKPPFEPLEEIPVRFLTIKTVLLLALTSLKRVGDLQALSVAPSHLEFSPGNIKAFLYPRPGYVPKVPTHPPQPVVLQAFCPPPFREPDQQKLNCMCPVRALDAYVHRAALWRKSEQLFVCYGPPKKGSPASKETLSRWIVDAISTAYESSDLPSPLGVKAHSTRALGASKAFSAGVPIQDICNAAGCSSTRQGFGSLVAWASRSQSVLRTQLEFLKGNVPVTERDAASRSILPASLPSARFIHEADAGRLRTCFYASWSMTSPARDVPLSHWFDYTFIQSVVRQGCSQSVLRTQRLVPSGNQERLENWVGVSGMALNWFRSYSEGRGYYVSIGEQSSKWTSMTCGVPQASILAPVLFSLYMLPLSQIMRKNQIAYHSYADDTQIYLALSPNDYSPIDSLCQCIDDERRMFSRLGEPCSCLYHQQGGVMVFTGLPKKKKKGERKGHDEGEGKDMTTLGICALHSAAVEDSVSLIKGLTPVEVLLRVERALVIHSLNYISSWT